MPSFDPHSHLLKQRKILIDGEILDERANVIMAQLLYLQFEDKEREIRVLISSPGGSVTASLAIYDTFRFLSNPILTCGMGSVYGMAALLLCAGTHSRRFMLRDARLCLGELWGPEPKGPEVVGEIERMTQMVNEIYAHHTDQTVEQIAEICREGEWIDASEARWLGFVDHVVDELPE